MVITPTPNGADSAVHGCLSFWRRSAVLRHVSEDATVSGLDIHGSMAVVSDTVFGPYQHGIHRTEQMVQIENCIVVYIH
ncbi:hypothetical protein H0G86_002436 [Trichoderma simmonsii]|uniref:Uncharacterized protein n=1 Tax=Trichoderma simmonsii TaxID=1491479 RepID=A0A8G0L3H7_9HYPO|nr:hypothetical protein H0G86_002436 [Trichoderma simmonsii]